MAIVVNLDVMMAKRKISLNELSERVGLTLSNLSILKTGKAKAIRFSTLEAICRALDCQPGDILEYVDDELNKQLSILCTDQSPLPVQAACPEFVSGSRFCPIWNDPPLAQASRLCRWQSLPTLSMFFLEPNSANCDCLLNTHYLPNQSLRLRLGRSHLPLSKGRSLNIAMI